METSGGSLTELQKRTLETLADIDPPFILGGGGALAIYLGHRQTRDLDLFWSQLEKLGEHPREIRRLLEKVELSTSVLQETPTFTRFRITDGQSAINLDLVADPTIRLERPVTIRLRNREFSAESLHDLLVNKLCALLGRSELRDLVDVEALVRHGVSLDDAIRQAPRKDGGFSPLTLAWVLQNFELEPIASASGTASADIERLDRFRRELTDKLIALR